jgi:C4-dicarboxylate transporter DctM subunit
MIHARFINPQALDVTASWAERKRATIRALPSMALALVVIGVIYTGAATPTEAAAIGFAAALVITGAMGTLTWKGFREAAFESMATTAAILLIVAGAKIFGKAITLYRIPQDVSMFIGQAIDTPLAFILVVSLVLLLMGLVFEALSMVLIMTPVLLPAAMGMRFDPIWFGVFMVIMVECALITPPVGLNLYVIQSVAKARLTEVAGGVLPFLLLMFLTVVILYLVPDLALYIPFKL